MEKRGLALTFDVEDLSRNCQITVGWCRLLLGFGKGFQRFNVGSCETVLGWLLQRLFPETCESLLKIILAVDDPGGVDDVEQALKNYLTESVKISKDAGMILRKMANQLKTVKIGKKVSRLMRRQKNYLSKRWSSDEGSGD
ncbi:hypothetical protein AVEN_129644-1 [Araneus ventricosus]|uniref:Uncharacterized protein n=1 Tax=Araneus ventricosus TaxID=182803 RepID=A0A4Y2X2K4_ARAVE|nr:hypothetical protein AVEN_129644-1 [Araneus ventricosus]